MSQLRKQEKDRVEAVRPDAKPIVEHSPGECVPLQNLTAQALAHTIHKRPSLVLAGKRFITSPFPCISVSSFVQVYTEGGVINANEPPSLLCFVSFLNSVYRIGAQDETLSLSTASCSSQGQNRHTHFRHAAGITCRGRAGRRTRRASRATDRIHVGRTARH